MTKYHIYILSAAILLFPASVMAEDTTVAGTTDTVVAKAEKIAEEVNAPLVTPAAAPDAAALMPSEPSMPLDVPVPTTSLDGNSASSEPAAAPIAEAPAIEAPSVVTEAIPTDNLEFISGEISSTDETTQSVTVKLYGETESGTSDKTLKVTVDGTTDITDGEQDRDLKSLTAGTEVDVEYDPATNKATYIFVY